MVEKENQRLSEFSNAIRESTLKRLKAVPEGKENWRPSSGAMSFADIAQHLIDTDNWLFKKLKLKNLDPIQGRAGSTEIANRNQYKALLIGLEETGKKRARILEGLRREELDEEIYDSRFDGKVTAWWIIVRGNLDHEIHHRGQLAVMLRILRS